MDSTSLVVNVLLLLSICSAENKKEHELVTVQKTSGKDGLEFSAFGKRFSWDTASDEDTLGEDIPVFTVSGNELRQENVLNHDTKITINKKAAVAVTTRAEHPQVDGWVMDGDEMYRITPADKRGSLHRVEVADEQMNGLQDYIDPYASASRPTKRSRLSRHGKMAATIELLVVVDNSIFRKTKSEENDDENTVMRKLKIYYTLFVASMNQRFQNIHDPQLSIVVVTSAIVIDRDRQSAPWAEYFARPNPDRTGMMLDAAVALDQFRVWVLAEKPKLPKFDHAMAFTDYNLVRQGTVDTSGMAYVNTMCDLKYGYSVSIMQELGGFATVGAATHELGHSLGARHDGDKNNRDCPVSMNNIMAPGNSNQKNVLKNFFFFSPCSIRQMKNAIRNESSDCLFHTRRSGIHFRKMQKPGQVFDINTQCQQMFGKKSSFCNEQRFIGEMCFRLWCRDPDTGLCRTTGAMVAAYGTTCGNNKWCLNGDCVFSPEAPRLQECHFGEMDTERCQELIREDIANCRNQQVRRMCCESCPKMMRMYYRFGKKRSVGKDSEKTAE